MAKNTVPAIPDMIDVFEDLASGVLDTGALGNDTDTSAYDDVPESSRNIAFRVWAFEAGRDPAKVASILAERTGVEIPVAVLRGWVRQGKWTEKSNQLHQTFKQHASETIDAHVTYGSVQAIRYLVDMLDDEKSSATAKVKSASILLGIAGYVVMPPGASAINIINHPTGDWANATDDELEELASSYQSGQAIPPPIDITLDEAQLSGTLRRVGIDDEQISMHPSLYGKTPPPRR